MVAEQGTQYDNTHPTQGFKAKQNKTEQTSSVLRNPRELTNTDGQQEQRPHYPQGALQHSHWQLPLSPRPGNLSLRFPT